MSDENTFRPVYLKDRNFIQSGYDRHMKQGLLTDSTVRSSYDTLSLKKNKGNIGNNDFFKLTTIETFILLFRIDKSHMGFFFTK